MRIILIFSHLLWSSTILDQAKCVQFINLHLSIVLSEQIFTQHEVIRQTAGLLSRSSIIGGVNINKLRLLERSLKRLYKAQDVRPLNYLFAFIPQILLVSQLFATAYSILLSWKRVQNQQCNCRPMLLIQRNYLFLNNCGLTA